MACVQVSVDQWILSSVYELRGHPFSLVDRHSDSLLLNTLRDDTDRKGRRSGRWSITLPFRFMSLANKAVEDKQREGPRASSSKILSDDLILQTAIVFNRAAPLNHVPPSLS